MKANVIFLCLRHKMGGGLIVLSLSICMSVCQSVCHTCSSVLVFTTPPTCNTVRACTEHVREGNRISFYIIIAELCPLE